MYIGKSPTDCVTDCLVPGYTMSLMVRGGNKSRSGSDDGELGDDVGVAGGM